MLSCWQLLVTQAQQQRNFLYMYPLVVLLSSGLGRVTMSLDAMMPFWVNISKHAMSYSGHHSSPRAVCETAWPEEGGERAPSDNSFKFSKISSFRLPSSEVSESIHLPDQDSLSKAYASENLAFPKDDKHLLWPQLLLSVRPIWETPLSDNISHTSHIVGPMWWPHVPVNQLSDQICW